MRELDQLLLGYLDRHYEKATAAEKQAFQSLLSLPDPELVGYLLNNQKPDPELQVVIDDILDRPRS